MFSENTETLYGMFLRCWDENKLVMVQWCTASESSVRPHILDLTMGHTFKVLLLVLLCAILARAHNKYSKEANNKDLFSKERPFRMQKLNLLWEKATKVSCLVLYFPNH